MSVSFSWSRAGDVGAPPVDAKQTVPIVDQLQRVHDAWNPQSSNCAFQHYFYNYAPPQEAGKYVMPPGQDPQKWERAVLSRPSANSVPVLAVGFTDLEKRISLQSEQVNTYRSRMHEIQEKLTSLQNRHDLHTTVKLLEMKERHQQLAKRALQLAIKIQVLSNRKHVLTPEEELFQREVAEKIAKAEDPAVFGSLNESWARLKALRERHVNASEVPTWEADGEQIQAIIKVLTAQQKGIKFLSQLVERDTVKIDEELGLIPKQINQLPVNTVAPQAFAAQVALQSKPQALPLGQGAAPGGLNGVGTAQNTQPQTGLFGSSQPQQTQQTQQPPQLGQGFGQQGGLFGSKPAFGQAQPTNQTQTQPQTQSSGLFGSQQPSTGLFGKPAQPAQPSTGLFGQSQQSQQPQQGGLFNNSQGLFNKPQTQPAFGQAQPQQTQPQPQSSLFNKPASFNAPTTPTPTLGLNQPNAPTTPAPFGQKPGFGGGLFGR